MTVFKYSLRLFWENKFSALIYFLIFGIISILATPKEIAEISFEESKTRVGYIDESRSELSEKLLEHIAINNYVENYEGKTGSENEIREKLFYSFYDVVIVIPKDFEEKVSECSKALRFFAASSALEENFKLESEVSSYLSLLHVTYDNGKYDYKTVDEICRNEAKVSILESKGEGRSILTWLENYFRFLTYAILAVLISVVGMVTNEFNVSAIAKRNAVSGITTISFNAHQLLSQLFFVFLLMIISMIVPFVACGTEIFEKKQTFYYFINASVFSLSSLCMIFCVNKITTNKSFISAFSTVFSLGSSFICGVFVEREFLGEQVLAVSKFFPASHYIDSIEEISQGLFPTNGLLIQTAFGLFFIIVGFYISKSRRDSRI